MTQANVGTDREDGGTPGRAGRITGYFHTGISVADLDRSLSFYRDQLGFEVVVQRDATDDYLRHMHGLPFTVVRIAFLTVPNSSTIIELIEYQGVGAQKPSFIPMDPATGHACLFVDDIHALSARLTAAGYHARSTVPVEILAGPNMGSWAIYFEDPDGFPLEFMQRANTAASQEQ